ncbi:unnamed protein product [Rotaria magnacalcarata]
MYYSNCLWIVFILHSFVLGIDSNDFNIHGTTSQGWEFVRDLFKDNFVQERDLGASMAIYYQGQPVVDLWGGWFDQSRTKPYDHNTLQYVFSTSKGLVAIAVALCVQRGLLDYSALVKTYWPEYGQNGKENTTVADILSHRAGLPLDDYPMERILNWTAMVHTLEQREPQWPPGTAHGYHPLTYGWLAGELVRRVDPKNRTFGQWVRDEITNPLQIEFYIGLPLEQEYRVSPIETVLNNVDTNDANEIFESNPFNDLRVQRAEIPAANGIANARSIALLYASLIGDLDHGKRKQLLSENMLKRAIKSNTPDNEIDITLGVHTKFGMGFLLYDDMITSLGSNVFGHSGLGGSVGLAAPAKNFSFSYVINRMNIDQQIKIDSRYKTMLDKIGSKLDDRRAF